MTTHIRPRERRFLHLVQEEQFREPGTDGEAVDPEHVCGFVGRHRPQPAEGVNHLRPEGCRIHGIAGELGCPAVFFEACRRRVDHRRDRRREHVAEDWMINWRLLHGRCASR